MTRPQSVVRALTELRVKTTNPISSLSCDSLAFVPGLSELIAGVREALVDPKSPCCADATVVAELRKTEDWMYSELRVRLKGIDPSRKTAFDRLQERFMATLRTDADRQRHRQGQFLDPYDMSSEAAMEAAMSRFIGSDFFKDIRSVEGIRRSVKPSMAKMAKLNGLEDECVLMGSYAIVDRYEPNPKPDLDEIKKAEEIRSVIPDARVEHVFRVFKLVDITNASAGQTDDSVYPGIELPIEHSKPVLLVVVERDGIKSLRDYDVKKVASS